MVVKRLWVVLVLLAVLGGCATARPETVRVALLAPFEGRYREVGYDLLYAARLGLQDAGQPNVELLPIDDGGTPESALTRARALLLDSSVRAVIVAGYSATSPRVLPVFEGLPVVVAGHWGVNVPRDHVFVLDANYGVVPRYTLEEAIMKTAPFEGGEVFALKQFPLLREDLDGVVIRSSAVLPDAEFAARLVESDLFVDAPGLLVTVGYDAARMLAGVVADAPARDMVQQRLGEIIYEGINGSIRFEGGYRADAPVNRYAYNADQQLTLQD